MFAHSRACLIMRQDILASRGNRENLWLLAKSSIRHHNFPVADLYSA